MRIQIICTGVIVSFLHVRTSGAERTDTEGILEKPHLYCHVIDSGN